MPIGNMMSVKKILVIFLSIACLFFLLKFYIHIKEQVHRMGMAIRIAKQIDDVVTLYIESNNGKFPESESDLIEQVLLKKVKKDNNYEYFMRSAFFDPQNVDDMDGWIKIWDFDLFKISYAIKPENYEYSNGGIYKKGTEEKVLFIDGPFLKNLQEDYYGPISAHWYELMNKYSSSNKFAD